jgi:hypothetical protein
MCSLTARPAARHAHCRALQAYGNDGLVRAVPRPAASLSKPQKGD